MATTAVITGAPTTLIINQACSCTVAITNGGGAALNVLGVKPTAIVTGSNPPDAVESCALGVVNLGPGAIVQVPASGTINYGFSAVFFSPSTGPIGAGTGTFDIGAQIQMSDGSNVSATVQTVTVNPIALPATEQ